MLPSRYLHVKILTSVVLVAILMAMTFWWSNHAANLVPETSEQSAGQKARQAPGQILGQDSNLDTNTLKLVSAREFSAGLEDDGERVLLDIRRPDEISQAKIENALEINYEASDFRAQIDLLDRDQHYYLYCNSGNRSARAAQMMKNMGFAEVTELRGGIQAWIGSGFPTCRDC